MRVGGFPWGGGSCSGLGLPLPRSRCGVTKPQRCSSFDPSMDLDEICQRDVEVIIC